jgi:hypothetical protein
VDIFNACNLIKGTTIQQINAAIVDEGDSCIADLIDDDTGLPLEDTMPEILQELFSTCGSITPQSIAAAKTKVQTITCNHSNSIVNVFTAIAMTLHSWPTARKPPKRPPI